MEKVMITIGRQFGSGGHKIGEYLANRLGLSYYDNELILLAAQRGDLHVEHIREMDEMIQNPFSFDKNAEVEDTLEETVFQLQQEVICQLAEKEGALFVGRCADEALRKAGRDDLIGTSRNCLVPPEGVKTAAEYAQIRREKKEREQRREERNARGKRPIGKPAAKSGSKPVQKKNAGGKPQAKHHK